MAEAARDTERRSMVDWLQCSNAFDTKQPNALNKSQRCMIQDFVHLQIDQLNHETHYNNIKNSLNKPTTPKPPKAIMECLSTGEMSDLSKVTDASSGRLKLPLLPNNSHDMKSIGEFLQQCTDAEFKDYLNHMMHIAQQRGLEANHSLPTEQNGGGGGVASPLDPRYTFYMQSSKDLKDQHEVSEMMRKKLSSMDLNHKLFTSPLHPTFTTTATSATATTTNFNYHPHSLKASSSTTLEATVDLEEELVSYNNSTDCTDIDSFSDHFAYKYPPINPPTATTLSTDMKESRKSQVTTTTLLQPGLNLPSSIMSNNDDHYFLVRAYTECVNGGRCHPSEKMFEVGPIQETKDIPATTTTTTNTTATTTTNTTSGLKQKNKLRSSTTCTYSSESPSQQQVHSHTSGKDKMTLDMSMIQSKKMKIRTPSPAVIITTPTPTPAMVSNIPVRRGMVVRPTSHKINTLARTMPTTTNSNTRHSYGSTDKKHVPPTNSMTISKEQQVQEEIIKKRAHTYPLPHFTDAYCPDTSATSHIYSSLIPNTSFHTSDEEIFRTTTTTSATNTTIPTTVTSLYSNFFDDNVSVNSLFSGYASALSSSDHSAFKHIA